MDETNLDILLIFPSLTKHEKYAGRKIKKDVGGGLPPLGLASLAAFMIEKGYTTKILEPVLMDLTIDDCMNEIRRLQPRVIGVSSLTSTYAKGVDIVKRVRAENPDKIIIMGGHHVSLFTTHVFENCPEVDLLVRGEGEMTLLELMQFFKKHKFNRAAVLADKKGLNAIDGIILKDKSGVVMTKPRELIKDINILPFPARHLLPIDKCIPLPIEYKRLPVVHMMVSRGCPFNCTYCSTHAAFGYRVRMRSPDKVMEEIHHVVDKYGARQISFWDDLLTVNKSWLLDLCNRIRESKLDIVWNCYAHINTIDDDMLKAMKTAGCFCIWYGIEAGDETLLKNINKMTKLDNIRRVVKLTKANGIEVRGLFMVGLPGETPELAQKTINFAKELDCDYAQFAVTTPHIGTQLYEDAKRFGTLTVDFSKFTQQSAVFVPHGYKDAKQVEAMCKKAYRDFYMRPSYMVKCLTKIRSVDDVKRYYSAFKIALAFT